MLFADSSIHDDLSFTNHEHEHGIFIPEGILGTPLLG
jgi:hypothetical protein